MTFANDDNVEALILAPNGAVRAGDRFVYSGAVAARRVVIGHDTRVTYDSGFQCSVAATCNDGLLCTSDLCSDGACENPPVANGTRCNSGTCQAGACQCDVDFTGTNCNILIDGDGDGVGDSRDNCPTTPNADRPTRTATASATSATSVRRTRLHRHRWDANLWELSTAVAAPGTNGCGVGGRFFISFRGQGIAKFVEQGDLDCRGPDVGNCSNDVYNGTLFPLRPTAGRPPERVAKDSSFDDNAMTHMPDGTILAVRDLALDILPDATGPLDDGAGVWASSDCGNNWEFRSFLESRRLRQLSAAGADGRQRAERELRPAAAEHEHARLGPRGDLRRPVRARRRLHDLRSHRWHQRRRRWQPVHGARPSRDRMTVPERGIRSRSSPPDSCSR